MNLRTSLRLVLAATALFVVALLVVGCGGSATSSQSSDSTGSASTQAADQTASQESSSASSSTGSEVNGQGDKLYTPTYKVNGKETAVIKTSKGTIEVKFYGKDAPIAVANFIELAQKDFYKGIKFHRYVAGFVIQGGDPKTKDVSSDMVAQSDSQQSGQFGAGGPGYAIKDEYANNPNLHEEGSLAMARTQMPDSGGSQFYFALTPLPQLDHQYTVFGKATKGLDVIKKLRAGDTIESITIENATK
jgi:peptidyl-prolyl cis-trans isomerase B (cyclophilin B)